MMLGFKPNDEGTTMVTAIQTTYAGCRFRSRLEARWAVFFETAGIGWEYEPEGFDIDGEWYLPDFRLDNSMWVEVKAVLTDRDRALLPKAAQQLGLLVVLGPIPQLTVSRYSYPDLADPQWSVLGEADDDSPPDGSELLAGFGMWHKNERLWWGVECGPLSVESIPDESEVMRPEIEQAYRAARAARFEHGEKG